MSFSIVRKFETGTVIESTARTELRRDEHGNHYEHHESDTSGWPLLTEKEVKADREFSERRRKWREAAAKRMEKQRGES